MKPLTLLGLALFSAGVIFTAAPSQAQNTPKPSAKQIIAQQQRERAQEEAKVQGMKLAPGMIAGQKLSCNLVDARLVTTGQSELNGKSSATTYVEVACGDNVGYVIGKRKDGLYVSSDCIETSGRGPDGRPSPLRCTLPENSKSYLALQPYVAASGSKCVVNKAAYIGASATAAAYEVGCADADGLRLSVATPRTPQSEVKAVPCYVMLQADKACTLTKPEQSMSYIAALALKAPKPCAATSSRLVGETKAGESFYEFACPDGSGFMVQADASGAFMRDITCEQAKPLGGCTLTGATATAAAPRSTPSAF